MIDYLQIPEPVWATILSHQLGNYFGASKVTQAISTAAAYLSE